MSSPNDPPPERYPGETSPRWLLVFAIPDEVRPFAAAWRATGRTPLQRERPGGLPRTMAVWRWELGEVWVCGMGHRNAARWVDYALGERRPERVVTAGLAGGLDPRWCTGDLLVSADPGFLPTFPGIQAGRFHCQDRIATTPAQKAALWADTGADAVEMESGIIRAGCAARGIPSATLRVISDAAQETLPFDFGTMLTADDRLDFGKLLVRVLGSPGKIPALLRLQRSVGVAGRCLAEALVQGAQTD